MISYFQNQIKGCYVIVFFETVISELTLCWGYGHKFCAGIPSILCLVFSARSLPSSFLEQKRMGEKLYVD